MKDDWRLRGQEDYLMGRELYYIKFVKYSEQWDHEHCDFCWAKFSEFDGDLHEGYCTEPVNNKEAWWICPECYRDFKEDFRWKIHEADNEKQRLKKQWRAAHKHEYLLEKEQVEELFAFLEEALDETPCDHTLKHTAKWIDQNCPDEQKKAVFEEIREAGGYCDCEVLLNCYEEYDIE